MQKDSIIFMLKAHGVSEEDLATFSLKLRDKSFTVDDCDMVLVKLGYDKLFTIEDDLSDQDENYDDYENDLNDLDDDSYSDYRSFSKKHTFDE